MVRLSNPTSGRACRCDEGVRGGLSLASWRTSDRQRSQAIAGEPALAGRDEGAVDRELAGDEFEVGGLAFGVPGEGALEGWFDLGGV